MIGLEAAAALDSATISLKERAYRIIKENIVSCRFPPGSILSEKDLVALVDASRTPIREALSRLEQEQLVVILPQRGSFVTAITAKMINDIYQVREYLEPMLVRQATAEADPAQLAAFRDRIAALSGDDFAAATAIDSELHSFVLRCSNNDCLIKMMESMYDHNERIRMLMARAPRRLRQSNEEHLAIVAAMLAGDGGAAAEAMRQHMVTARRAALRFQLGDYE